MLRRAMTVVAAITLVFVAAPSAQAAFAPAWRTDLGAAANDVAVGPGGARSTRWVMPLPARRRSRRGGRS